MRRPWFFAALAAVVSTGALAWYLTPIPHGPGQAPRGAAIALGGPFELTAHTGQSVTDKSFDGKLLLVFFGYTYCPDICPTTLNRVALALDALGPDADGVQPLFVTVDPARDTPEVLADYVAAFPPGIVGHPGIVGLTGTAAQIARVAKSYRAYFAKAENSGGDPDTYLMDHSVLIYLIGPDGGFLTMFPHTAGPGDIAAGIEKYLARPAT